MKNQRTPPETNAKPITKTNVPAADIDFGKLVTDGALAWASKPKIALILISTDAFTISAPVYNTELLSRNYGGST